MNQTIFPFNTMQHNELHSRTESYGDIADSVVAAADSVDRDTLAGVPVLEKTDRILLPGTGQLAQSGESLQEGARLGLPSASNWHRLEKCPASHRLTLEAKKLGQLAYSAPTPEKEKGDRIHYALACNRVELLEDDERESARILEELREEQIRIIFEGRPVQRIAEKRYWLEFKGQKVASGQADLLVTDGVTLLIQDYKTGFSAIDIAEKNAQLKFLAVVAALHFLPRLQLVIVQIISNAFGVSEHRFTVSDLSEAYQDVLKTLRAINEPQPEFHPSFEACKYCPGVNICQATKDLILPTVRTVEHSPLPDVPERAAKLLDEVELLCRHLEQVKQYFTRKLKDEPDYKIPGWQLASGPPKRTVTDWSAARAKLEQYIPAQALDGIANFNIIEIESLLGSSLGIRGEKRKAELAKILGDLLTLKYPEPTLKRNKPN
jgi:uncharacterized protein DUF2800